MRQHQFVCVLVTIVLCYFPQSGHCSVDEHEIGSNITSTTTTTTEYSIIAHHLLASLFGNSSQNNPPPLPDSDEPTELLFTETVAYVNGVPAAFGDFDSDHYTDIFFLTNQGLTLEAFKGSSCVDGRTILTYFGSRKCLTRWKDFQCTFETPIYNVVASDFTGMDRLDFLITVASESNPDYYSIILVEGNVTADSFSCSKRKVLIENALTEPFILDYNGDMVTDFIVQTNECSMLLWLCGTNLHPILYGYFTCLDIVKEKFQHPHSNAFVNLNNHVTDMTPDIYINGESKIHYIMNVPKIGYDKYQNFSYPQATIRGQSAFVDINYDGQLEHLIPVCLDNKASSFADCRQSGVMLHDGQDKWHNVLFTNDELVLGANMNRTLTFANVKLFKHLTIPVTLRVADLNYDGYPDFATILQDLNDHSLMAAIFLNVENKIDDDQTNIPRMFELSWISKSFVNEDVVVVSFFDIYNNGRLNLLLTKFYETNQTLETISYDYYAEKTMYYSFLRVNVISGRCSDKSDSEPCPIKSKLALGTNPPGCVACFEGPFSSQQSCSVQLSQSAHFALQLPYMVFGLGDTLNVVSNLLISIPNGNQSQRSHSWTETIPGSNLVVVPYKINQPDMWDIRVYINMSIYSMVSLAFLVLLGLMLIVAIYVLHYKEKQEDKIEIKEYKQHWL